MLLCQYYYYIFRSENPTQSLSIDCIGIFLTFSFSHLDITAFEVCIMRNPCSFFFFLDKKNNDFHFLKIRNKLTYTAALLVFLPTFLAATLSSARHYMPEERKMNNSCYPTANSRDKTCVVHRRRREREQ